MSPHADHGQAREIGIPVWLPNAISVLRILMVPLYIWLASECQELARNGQPGGGPRAQAFAVLVAIGLSDMLDGFLARRYRLTSVLGATLDAVADKIAQIGLLLFFTLDRGPGFTTVPVWFVVLIIARDVYMLIGWLVVRRQRGRVNVEHKFHGKLASVLIFALLLWITTGFTGSGLLPALWLIVAVVVASCASYFRDGWVQLKASQANG
jgi:CDP-diacylglycerol--glycerol-3-phosphate 3-phosphatidyltransferase